MRASASILILFSALACFAPVIALAETVMDLDVTISATLKGKLRPAVSEDAPRRAVLILHGWNDHLDGLGDLQKKLATQLSERNIASLRFNFTGEGERVNYVVTSTYHSRMAEASAAYWYLKKAYPDASIGVQGWSLGGLIAISLAGENPDWFESMVLWSAADNMRVDRDAQYDRAARGAMQEGHAVYSTWTEITLTREFLSSYIGVNASEKFSRYPGSFLTIRGDADYLESHDRRWLSLLPTTDKAFLLLGGADHVFNVLTDDASYSRRVLEETSKWLDRTLK